MICDAGFAPAELKSETVGPTEGNILPGLCFPFSSFVDLTSNVISYMHHCLCKRTKRN